MTITAYAGLPGSGKSYSVVENVIIPALKAGRVVAHNLTLNVDALRVVCDRDVTPQLVQLSRDASAAEIVTQCPLGAVIVLDEVWRYWPAGTKANEVPKPELAFFKEHRHRVGADGLASEIYVLDQDLGTGVPAFIRSLVDLTYLHTKLSAIGASKNYRVDVYTRAQSAMKPVKSAKLRSMQGRYKPEVFNCYVSHTQATNPGEAGLEVMPDKRGNLLKSWPVRAAFVAAVLLPFLAWFAISSVFGMVDGGGIKEGSELATQQGSPAGAETAPVDDRNPVILADAAASTPSSGLSSANAVPAPAAAPQAAPGAVSGQWRVLGVIVRDDGSGKVLLASATGRRTLNASDCSQDAGYNWRCQVEDGHATMWSGAGREPLRAAQTEGVGTQPPPLAGTEKAAGV